MRNLHPDVQCQALTEYANRRSKDTLNNPPAYFMSLLQVGFGCRYNATLVLTYCNLSDHHYSISQQLAAPSKHKSGLVCRVMQHDSSCRMNLIVALCQ